MVEGAKVAIEGILSTVQPYFPSILAVAAGLTGLTAVVNFVRSAG